MILQQDVLEGWLGHNHAILQTLRAGKDDEVLLEQSEADAAAGFCTPPLTQQQLQAVLQQRPYRLIPRCMRVQSSGKKRIIDNAETAAQVAESQGNGWESGGEDWPNAYRHSPMGDEESLGCVVAFFHHQWGRFMGTSFWVTACGHILQSVFTAGRESGQATGVRAPFTSTMPTS